MIPALYINLIKCEMQNAKNFFAAGYKTRYSLELDIFS